MADAPLPSACYSWSPFSFCFLSPVVVSLLESSHPLAEGPRGRTQDGSRPARSLPWDFIWAMGNTHTFFVLQVILSRGSATEAVGQPVSQFPQNPLIIGKTSQVPTWSHGSPWKPPGMSWRSVLYPLLTGDGELTFPQYSPFTNLLYLEFSPLFYILKVNKNIWVIE